MSAQSKFGRRFSFRAAAAYLDIPESRLRRLVAEKRIAYVRSDGRILRRRRPAGGFTSYVKSGRVEFYQVDLDAYLEAQRVPATQARASAAPRPRAVDLEVEQLIGVDRVFG